MNNPSTLSPATETLPLPSWQVWTGRVLSLVAVLMLLMSATMKLTHNPQMIDQFTGKFGFQASLLTGLAVLEASCVVLYVVPRTAVLGAILLTGYLGGAIVTHLRVGDAFVPPLLLGVFVWAGLYLREPRLRALLPLRLERSPGAVRGRAPG